ncbi:MAG: nitrogen regulation protein NR(II) [Sandaracinaceae bacterium]
MSPAATLLITWAAIYAYAGAFHSMLRAHRPEQPEYAAFARVCFGLAVWTLGAALAADAESGSVAHSGVQLGLAGGYFAVGALVEFALRLHPRRTRPGWVKAVYGGALLATLLDLAGLVVAEVRLSHHPGAWLARPTAVIELTPIGYVVATVFTLLAVFGIVEVARATRARPALRLFVGGLVIAVAVGVFDLFAPMVGGSPLQLTEHAGLLPVLALSAILMRRFAQSSGALEERTEELRGSYRELRKTQEELVRQEQLAAVGELSAVIAHEVRNPLAIIKNAHSSLKRRTLSHADRTVLLEIVDEEVDRLGRLTRALLTYARPVTPHGRRIDLRELLHDSVDRAVQSALAPVDVKLEDVALPLFEGDPELLAQALRNLIENGVLAMPEGGRLMVRGRAHRVDGVDGVLLEIEDEGEGMDEDTLLKARDPFFTTRPAGTGLGLAIADKVIRSHGGTLTLTSEPGSGTLARITLPGARP